MLLLRFCIVNKFALIVISEDNDKLIEKNVRHYESYSGDFMTISSKVGWSPDNQKTIT